MDMVAQFLKLVDAYASATDLAESTVSSRLFNDGKRIGNLRDKSGDIGILKIRDAIAWLSAHWPADVAWPPEIPRPPRPRGTAGGNTPAAARA